MKIGAIILAAGPSSRMGQSKQLLPVDGKPLLTRTINTIVQSGIQEIVCVLGANEEEHRALLAGAQITIIQNIDWPKGMGSSLKKGIDAFRYKYPSADGAIIFVCDQPMLSTAHIHKLIEKKKASGKNIIASAYAQTLGVPVLFDKQFFGNLINIPDEVGAKKIISSHVDEVASVDFPEGAIDIDTPEDYRKFQNKPARS